MGMWKSAALPPLYRMSIYKMRSSIKHSEVTYYIIYSVLIPETTAQFPGEVTFH